MSEWVGKESVTTTYKTGCGRFEVCFIATRDEVAGKIEPFSACWNVQYLGDGTQEFFDTEEECKAWIKEWDEIG